MMCRCHVVIYNAMGHRGHLSLCERRGEHRVFSCVSMWVFYARGAARLYHSAGAPSVPSLLPPNSPIRLVSHSDKYRATVHYATHPFSSGPILGGRSCGTSSLSGVACQACQQGQRQECSCLVPRQLLVACHRLSGAAAGLLYQE